MASNFQWILPITLINLGLVSLLTACNKVQVSPAPSPSLVAVESPSPTPPPLLVSPAISEVNANQKVQDYLKRLKSPGILPQPNGIWIQTGETLFANEQGTNPLGAASLTKVATSLVALQTLGIDHQYITELRITGEVKNGVLNGDLWIQGGGDPFLVWEDAIALGNLLNQIGIKKITGNLIISDKFYINFETNPIQVGELWKESINSNNWFSEAEVAYANLVAKNPQTPKPQVVIIGNIKAGISPPNNSQLIIRHYSLPLTELVKKMNQYSNNAMAEMIADSVGGAKIVAQKSASIIGLPEAEIQLENGSGLSNKNRMSPRAAVGLFLALEKFMAANNLTIADTLTIAGQDPGVLDIRPLPVGSVVKSGTLNTVSALGGVLPTEKYGLVWFAILNNGEIDLEKTRREQEIFLDNLLKDWQLAKIVPAKLTASASRKNKTSRSEIFQNP